MLQKLQIKYFTMNMTSYSLDFFPRFLKRLNRNNLWKDLWHVSFLSKSDNAENNNVDHKKIY